MTLKHRLISGIEKSPLGKRIERVLDRVHTVLISLLVLIIVLVISIVIAGLYFLMQLVHGL